MTGEATTWTPDQPLRAGASDEDIWNRRQYILHRGNPDDSGRSVELVARELAAAEVAAYRERVWKALADGMPGSCRECGGSDAAWEAFERVPLTTPEAP